jgi:hypothetical protein
MNDNCDFVLTFGVCDFFFVLKRDNYYSAIAIFSPYLKGRTYTALELHRIEIHMLEKEVNLFKLMNKILSP